MDDSFLSYHYPVPELAKKWKMGLEETGRKVRQDAFSRAEADYFGKSETADLQGGGRVSAAREGKLRIRIALAHNENDGGGNFAPQSLQRNGAERSGFYFAGAG